MKTPGSLQHLIFFIFLGTTLSINAQNPVIPSGQKPGQLPAPKKLTVLTNDVQITGARSISVDRNETSGAYMIKFSVTIKNNGGIRTGNTQLAAQMMQISGGSTNWLSVCDKVSVSSIDPGATLTAEYIFKCTMLSIGDKPVKIRLVADGGSALTETNEFNNYSAEIRVVPPGS